MLPIITIARQYGSGGHEVGERLAEKLNVPLLDKQLIAMAAKKSGLSEEVFEKADEKAGNSLLYSMVMGNYTFGSRITGINDMPINDKLFILQSDIIKSAADKARASSSDAAATTSCASTTTCSAYSSTPTRKRASSAF